MFVCVCVFTRLDVCSCMHSLNICLLACVSARFLIGMKSVPCLICVQVSCLSWYRIRPLSSASALDTTLLTSLFATRAAHSQKSQTSTDGPLRDRKLWPHKCFIGLMPFFLIDFLSSVPLSSLVHCLLPSVPHGFFSVSRLNAITEMFFTFQLFTKEAKRGIFVMKALICF